MVQEMGAMSIVGDPIRLIKDLGAPIGLLLVGGVGKSIVRPGAPDNWFMGPDLVLAGIGAGLAYVLDDAKTVFFGSKAPADVTDVPKHGFACFGYVISASFLFLL